MPGTGRGAFSHILKPSFSSIVNPPIDCAHCVGAANVVVIANVDSGASFEVVEAAADMM